LYQSTEFEVGETLGISATVDEDDTCYDLGDAFIKVYDFDATLVGRSYMDFVAVYQQFIKHPTVLFQSEKGEQEGSLLVGSFLLDGKSSAVGFRVGGTITNNLSYYYPIGIKQGG